MILAGIRNVKSHLSQYIKRVQHGETVTITDHGKEVAVLSSISQELKIDPGLVELMREGVLKGAGLKPKSLKPPIRLRKGKSASRMILEDRG